MPVLIASDSILANHSHHVTVQVCVLVLICSYLVVPDVHASRTKNNQKGSCQIVVRQAWL